jgi:hypothetical protein
MTLLPDILTYITQKFPAEQRDVVTAMVDTAVLHDGSPAGPRCQRAALVGSHGTLEKLERLIADLEKDYRDVIVEGEYEVHEKKLIRVRDLNQPFETNSTTRKKLSPKRRQLLSGNIISRRRAAFFIYSAGSASTPRQFP